MHKIYILLTTLCLAILPVLSSAQSRNQEAAAENDIISAVALYNERNFDGAKAILDRLRVDSPSNDAAWYWSALVCLGKNDIPAAEEYLKVACDLDPSNFWYRFRLATLYRVTSRQELTVDMYEKLLADFPKKSDLYFDLVDMYTAQGETEKALETLKEIETVFGMTESIAMFRFNLLQQSGRQEEAFASLEEYNKKYSSPYVLTTLGDYQMNMYNDSTALAYYNEALDIAPDYIPAVIGKAETFRVTRRYDEYFTALDKLITSDDAPAAGKSDYLMAIVQRTDPKFLKSFMPQMDKVMETMTEKYPQDSTVLQMAGVYYWTTERRDISKKHFRQNVENNPGSIMATADFVEFLMYAEDWKALSEEGRRAFERFPDETTFL